MIIWPLPTIANKPLSEFTKSVLRGVILARFVHLSIHELFQYKNDHFTLHNATKTQQIEFLQND